MPSENANASGEVEQAEHEDRHPVAAASHADDHDRDQQTGSANMKSTNRWMTMSVVPPM